MAFQLQKGQPFNVFVPDNENLDVTGSGKSAYFKFSASAWGSNKNQESADKPFKEKGDPGYEVPVFAVAFGDTAVQISEALKAAQAGGAATASFTVAEGCFVKKRPFEKDGATTYKDEYVFNKVNAMSQAQKEGQGESTAAKEQQEESTSPPATTQGASSPKM